MQPVFMPPMRGFEPYPFEQGEAPAVPTPGYPVVFSGVGDDTRGRERPALPKWAIPAAIGLLALWGLAFWYHMSVVNKLKRQGAGEPRGTEEEVEDVEVAPKLKRRTAKRNPKKAQVAFARAEKKAKKATAAWLAPKTRKAKKSKSSSATSKQTENLASTPAPRRRQKAAKALVAAAALPAHDASHSESSSED